MNTPTLGTMHLSLPLLLLLAKATLILLAALGVTLSMQRASAGARHLVWLVTLATLLLVPALTAWSPVKLAVLPTERAAASGESTSPVVPPRAAMAPAEVTPAAPIAAPTPVAAPSEPASSRYSLLVARYSLTTILLAAWALVALAILASLAWSGLAVRRIVRNASPLEHDAWRTPLYEVADRMGLADAPRLLRSDDAKMPFACGIVTPTIVLPADCDAWSLERRRAVLLHELAHVRRHDLLGHTLGRLACALYWFHPLVWTAAKQLRNESERACDDLALSCGTRATDYAEHLLDIVTSVRRDATPSVALAMARRKEFEGRMLAILDPELRRSSPTRRQSAAMIGSLALVAVTVGAVSPVARTADAAVVPAVHSADAARHDANSLLLGPQRTVFHADTTYAQVTSVAEQVDEHLVERLAPRVVTKPRGDTDLTDLGDALGRSVGATVDATVNAVANATVKAVAGATAKASADFGIGVANAVIGGDAGRSPSTRILGVPTQGQSKDERARLLAKVLATDTSAALRRVAAWGLNEYAEQPVATDALAAALRRDASATVREMAAWALAEAGSRNSTASDALSAALQGDASDMVRATAAWALGEAGDRSSIPALVSAIKSPSRELRMRAIWAIGSIEPKEAPPALLTALRDEDPSVRKVAAWALFSIEDPAAAGALQDAVKVEQDRGVQLAEIRAIGALGERSVDALKTLVDSPDPRIRSVAVHALAGGQASGPWPWPWPMPRPFP